MVVDAVASTHCQQVSRSQWLRPPSTRSTSRLANKSTKHLLPCFASAGCRLSSHSSSTVNRAPKIAKDGLIIHQESDNLLVFLGLDTGGTVGDGNAELVGTLHNFLALADADAAGDLGAERAVVEEEDFELAHVGHTEDLKAVGEQVAGLLVVLVTNLGHGGSTLELTAVTGVNTARAAPGFLGNDYTKQPNLL